MLTFFGFFLQREENKKMYMFANMSPVLFINSKCKHYKKKRISGHTLFLAHVSFFSHFVCLSIDVGDIMFKLTNLLKSFAWAEPI